MTQKQLNNSDILLTLSKNNIQRYLDFKTTIGLKKEVIKRYETYLNTLYEWLPVDKLLNKQRLIAWRKMLENKGYQDITIRKYVTCVNNYLKFWGLSELCFRKTTACQLEGKTFGYLKVINKRGKNKRNALLWECLCRCGNTIIVSSTQLTTGNTTSCGCSKKVVLANSNRYIEGTSLRQSLDDQPISHRAISGYTGVKPRNGKWVAYITYKRRWYNLGTFDDIDDAINARAEAKEKVKEDALRLFEETDYLFSKKN